jgi:hypothetical protein
MMVNVFNSRKSREGCQKSGEGCHQGNLATLATFPLFSPEGEFTGMRQGFLPAGILATLQGCQPSSSGSLPRIVGNLGNLPAARGVRHNLEEINHEFRPSQASYPASAFRMLPQIIGNVAPVIERRRRVNFENKWRQCYSVNKAN